jgi:hypothetical protein
MFTTDPYPTVYKKDQQLRFVGEYPSLFLKKGEVYTVAAATPHTLFLKEVFGPIFQPRFFEVVEEVPTPTETTAQEKAIVGGLQAHSVGSCYPFAFVGYGHGDRVVYCLENLQTGEVAAHNGRPFLFPSYASLTWAVGHFANRMEPGRPTFTATDDIVLAVPTSRAIKA